MERSDFVWKCFALCWVIMFEGASTSGRYVDASASAALPFVVLHGIGDACKHRGMSAFTSMLMDATGADGYCLEIGNGASDSFLCVWTYRQADIVCEQVKSIKGLQNGYNLVGLSQGNVIGRAVIEYCEDGPPVNNFVSIGGPHAGIAAVPLCKVLILCKLLDAIIKFGVYSPYVQNNFAPTGYVKIPTDLEAYYRGCLFLPKLNNELPEGRNETYKRRFSAINKLALIKFERDDVLFPADTAWFGFFAPNDFSTLLPAEKTQLYREDWIGLRTLQEGGKVTYYAAAGGHLEISEAEIIQMVTPFLLPNNSSPVHVTASHFENILVLR